MSSVLRTEGRLEDLLVCSAFFFCRCGVIYCRTKDVTKVCTLTAQYSVQEPHAPQLFRFPLPQTLQLVSKSKPMEQAKSHGKRGILHVSLRRATLLTALARTGSPKASSCSKTSDGEQDPGGLLSMSNCFYICQRLSITNLWVFFIFVISHCQRLVFPFLQYVCFQISRREICHRQSLWSLVPVSMDTGRCRSQRMERGTVL